MERPSEPKSWFIGSSEIIVGRYTYGYETMKVQQWGEGASLTIGAFSSIAKGLTVMLGGNHRSDWATTFPFGHIFQDELGGKDIVGHPSTKGDIVIGSDVWIGQNVTIMSGVSIGDGAIIAANSTVTKCMSSYEIWGGNPAKLIKKRFPDDIISKLIALKWWDQSIDVIRNVAPMLSQVPTRELLDHIQLQFP